MSTHFLKESKHLMCSCGAILDGAINSVSDGEEERGPAEGDLSICAYCGSINEFKMIDDELGLVQFPQEKLDQLISSDPMTAMQLLATKQHILINKAKEHEN